MRVWYIGLVLMAGAGLSSCSRRDEPAASQAGREAYRTSQEIKRGAKKAAKELQRAGKELREGWNEAKREAKREEAVRPKEKKE